MTVRSNHWLKLLGLVMASGMLLAACGDDGDSAGGDGGGEGAECQASVCMEGIAYTETEITTKAGEPVDWTNLDSVPHTITEGTADEPVEGGVDSGEIGEGESFEQSFDEAGEFAYYCTIHPQMQGKVIVE